MQTHSRNEKESVFKFNEIMKQFQLDKSYSPIYLYQKEETNDTTPSLSCDLGPTFPANKYDEYYEFITLRGIVHPLLALIEAPGTGKTHFAYHLISKGYTVLMIPPSHKSILLNSMQTVFNDPKTSSSLGGSLDWEISHFIRSYMIVADIIIRNMAKLETKDSIEKTNLYLFKYILNGGFKMVEEAFRNRYLQLRYEMFSYHFTTPLSILDAKQVTNFLDMFIDTSRKGHKNPDLWKLVATFLQGPIGRCEEFLQQLYLELQKPSTPRSFTELIYSNLCTLVFNRSQKSYRQEKIDTPLYKSLFYRLALLGEANFALVESIVSCFDEENASKLLLKHGLSFTYDDTNKIYKIVSPIERMRLLKTLQQEGSNSDLFLNAHKQLNQIHDVSPLSEVAAVYFVLNHFEFFKQQFPGTYLQNYDLPAKYYVEDSEISQISSLLINTIHCNMKEFQTDHYPLTGNNDLLPQFLVRSYLNAGPDVLGMLIRSSNIDYGTFPLCIPIVAAVTRKTGDDTQFKKNYATTDLSNLNDKNLATSSSPSTNDLALNERNSLNSAITDIMKAGNMLRILFHPNETFDTPLSERIPQYDHEDAPQIVFSDHAVLTKKGHCIYEISKNNSEWKNYLHNNNLSVVGDMFNDQ
ncbi:hypothetical protein FDP41_006152 [Naegleria fowleri]|uniref:Uncharacterized protein n=1 Tax=Naegleria fowleri TaxID=5763 RepID=A0A6A5BKJ6_NAEFO|nr:uncharacterized protein FDP41_006152 [Naegleria fowleri]KAF0974678.1 hypothetical protein FDP41_006152 [Naegleria fowleri]